MPTLATAPLAIVAAMHQELRALLALLDAPRRITLGGREFHLGSIHGAPVVLALSGIGKVAAATTAVLMLQTFEAERLVFTGVAGGLGDGVEVGDIVVASELLQHDMDASPLFPRFEIPLTGRSRFGTDATMAQALAAAAQGLPAARVHRGLIISGDAFIGSAAQGVTLRALLPDALAVEMEGAAVAQVCADFGRPFGVVRTISDRADDAAHGDFARFIDEIASVTTRALIEAWLRAEAHSTDAATPLR